MTPTEAPADQQPLLIFDFLGDVLPRGGVKPALLAQFET